jgi:hypothetical protein
METTCSHCQKSFVLPIKKSVRRCDRIHKIVQCPHCARKNYISVLQDHGESK